MKKKRRSGFNYELSSLCLQRRQTRWRGESWRSQEGVDDQEEDGHSDDEIALDPDADYRGSSSVEFRGLSSSCARVAEGLA
jgi:hypothetical protein